MTTRFNPIDHPVCYALPQRITYSEWAAHVPLGMLLVDLLRPRVLVELGTHHGVSYCAFCQAVDMLGLETACYAVDTWQGDPHAGHYGGGVLSELKAYHDPLYGRFSRLVQATFDEAMSHFADQSVDLLHIDGLHTYDAVAADFEHWVPKMSARGVILFHDINVREQDFGVWKLWDTLKVKHPSFDVQHGHGLGILAVGREARELLCPLLDASPEEAREFRTLMHQLGLRVQQSVELMALREKLRHQDEELAWLRDTLKDFRRIEGNPLVRLVRVWTNRGPRHALRRMIDKTRAKGKTRMETPV